MSGNRVLVVGTTRDYIEYLDRARPGKIVFLTDPSEYPDRPAGEDGPLQVFCRLSELAIVVDELESFLHDEEISLSGIACFDCESLILAATLAARYKLPFPSVQAVFNCRDKFRSKMFWTREGIPCPRAIKAKTSAQAAAFFDTLDGPAILKPATMSGSEAIFRCDSRGQVVEAFERISDRLKTLLEDPANDRDGLMEDSVLCEEYIEGPEYSCDFVRTDGPPVIIRLARKYLAEEGPPGTATAYEVPFRGLPIPEKVFVSILDEAVRSLGLERCMGMADFIIRDSLPYFLEITPRPGGDCLPPLIRASSGFDILTAAIDFSEGRRVVIPPSEDWRHLVGLRVHAGKAGLLGGSRLSKEKIRQEILEESWIRRPGERIKLPPDDYRSWMLGHVIFSPRDDEPVSLQIGQVRSAIDLSIEEEIPE